MYVPPVTTSRPRLTLPFLREVLFFISSSKSKKWSSLILEIQFPMFFYVCLKVSHKWKVVTKNKMDNPTFVDEEDIPLINKDDDCDDYTPDTSRVNETLFTVPDTAEATSTLRLRQKLKWDKIVSLYRHLDVTGDPGLADLDRFMIKKNSKTGNIELLFLNGNKHWQSLTNKWWLVSF